MALKVVTWGFGLNHPYAEPGGSALTRVGITPSETYFFYGKQDIFG